MQGKTQRSKAKERYWRDKIELQTKSGLSQKAFCSREGINCNSFSWWKKTVRDRDAEVKQTAQAIKNDRQRAYRERKRKQVFVQLAHVPEEMSAPPQESRPNVVAEIVFTGGSVRIIAGADVATLRALIQALKEDSGVRTDEQHENIPLHGRHRYAQEF